MKLVPSCAWISIVILTCCAFSLAQPGAQPIETTLCELYQHPDQYAGKMVRVRGTIAGNDMWIDTFTEKPCPSWMSIVVVFPDQVKPAPDFALVKDDSFKKFEEAMYHPRPIHIEATFEGRFDSTVTMENGKRIKTGKGYGKKHQHNGRIVLHQVSDVTARPLGRK
jgi:hypothetical protein